MAPPGVHRRCYEQVITRDMVCLDKAGRIDVALRAPPVSTRAPEDVVYELNISSIADDDAVNSTGMVWYLEAKPDPDVVTSIVPMSGILQPGEVQAVTVVNSPKATAPFHVVGGVLGRGMYPRSSQFIMVNMSYSHCESSGLECMWGGVIDSMLP